MKQRARQKRFLLAAFDGCAVLFLATLLVFSFASPAYAYVDPSVMTYTIQALTGVAVALSAVAGVALRRTRKILMKKLGLDENAHKTVEPVVHRVDPRTGRTVRNACDSQRKPGKHGRHAKEDLRPATDLPWPRRLAFSFVACLFTFGTVFLIAPLDLMAGNAGDLVIGVNPAGWVMTGFAGAVVVATTLLLSALRGKAFHSAFALVVALGVCAWVQAMFLNAGLPAADGSKVVWDDFSLNMVSSTVVWVVILLASLAFTLWKPSVARLSLGAACIFLAVIQAVGTTSLVISSAQQVYEQGLTLTVTERGLLTVSPKNNVIVFVLDTTDTTQVQKNVAQDPGFLDEMEGFTWFTDSTGSLIPTRYGIPFLLTDKMPQAGETFDEYCVRRYQDATLIPDIADAGYSVGLYSEDVENGRPYLRDYAMNVTSITPEKVLSAGMLDIPSTINAWCCCALYRDLPWSLKPFYWYYTDWVNNQMVNAWAQDEDDLPYEIDDPAFYNKLRNKGLSIQDSGENGAFRLILLLGSHHPYRMNEQAERIFDGSGTIMGQTAGAFHIVDEYLRQMKELGLYEDATIIVTADHGYFGNSPNHAWWTSSPVLMVKPSGVGSGPCQASTAQTGHVDYAATVLQAVGSPSYQDHGNTVWEAPGSGRTRYYCHLLHDPALLIDYSLEEYEITGNVLDFKNWRLDGNEWVITPKE